MFFNCVLDKIITEWKSQLTVYKEKWNESDVGQEVVSLHQSAVSPFQMIWQSWLIKSNQQRGDSKSGREN